MFTNTSAISSFKIRGIGETMQKSAAKSFVGSSGGNAGKLYLSPSLNVYLYLESCGVNCISSMFEYLFVFIFEKSWGECR